MHPDATSGEGAIRGGSGALRSVTCRGRGTSAEQQLLAWRLFLRAHALVTRRLETDLLAEQHMPLASYDVLVQLVEAPQRRLRMTELAERVLLSRSGLTRLVDRLEREGLVRREACLDDARGLFTVLLPAGVEKLREASGTHLRGVAEHAVGRLDEEEAAQLSTLLGRMIDDSPRRSARSARPAASVAGADPRDLVERRLAGQCLGGRRLAEGDEPGRCLGDGPLGGVPAQDAPQVLVDEEDLEDAGTPAVAGLAALGAPGPAHRPGGRQHGARRRRAARAGRGPVCRRRGSPGTAGGPAAAPRRRSATRPP